MAVYLAPKSIREALTLLSKEKREGNDNKWWTGCC